MSKSALEVLVNGEAQRVPGGCTIDGLLGQMGVERHRIAVAVNREVVPRSSFRTHPLEEGDRVEILEAVGGGA